MSDLSTIPRGPEPPAATRFPRGWCWRVRADALSVPGRERRRTSRFAWCRSVPFTPRVSLHRGAVAVATYFDPTMGIVPVKAAKLKSHGCPPDTCGAGDLPVADP